MFRLGINYWPISSAMYWWQRFDAAEVSRDFATIRAAGFHSVRIFLLWEDFQPQPTQISETALRQLATVADIASGESVSLVPTFFTGHMSGVNWIPSWALEPSTAQQRFRIVAGNEVVSAAPRNWFTDKEVLDAQVLLAGEVASRLNRYSNIWAWDLGNENSNVVIPPDRDAALEWLERITTAIRSADPNRPITIGLHMEDLEEDRRLGPFEAGKFCDFLCMHGYPIYASWSRGKKDSCLLPFLGVITRWLGGREVLFEEFGAPTFSLNQHDTVKAGVTLLSENESAEFTDSALRLLSHFGMLGAFVWCFGDYAPDLWDKPPLDQAIHERYFGLWRSDRSAKPAIEVISRFRTAQDEVTTGFGWIDISRDQFYAAPAQNLQQLYDQFLRMFEADC
jgi:endo-1,4-beta-mannosidase